MPQYGHRSILLSLSLSTYALSVFDCFAREMLTAPFCKCLDLCRCVPDADRRQESTLWERLRNCDLDLTTIGLKGCSPTFGDSSNWSMEIMIVFRVWRFASLACVSRVGSE